MMARRVGLLLVVVAVSLALLGWGGWSGWDGGAGGADVATSFGALQPAGKPRPGHFLKVRSVAVAPDQTLWILDLTGRIQHMTMAGAYLGEIRLPSIGRGSPQGLDVAPNGDILVADTHYNRILRYAPDGRLRFGFGQGPFDGSKPEPGELFWPCAVVAAPDGTIYTGEYGAEVDRIQVWTAGGEYLRHFGGFGERPGAFSRPAGLAIGPRGLLHVADAGNGRIQVFRTDGALVRILSRPGGLLYPYDVAVDGEGRVHAVEYSGHRVTVFDAGGAFLRQWGTLQHRVVKPKRPQPVLGLNSPWGVDVTAEGRAFVADSLNARIVTLPPPDALPLPDARPAPKARPAP